MNEQIKNINTPETQVAIIECTLRVQFNILILRAFLFRDGHYIIIMRLCLCLWRSGHVSGSIIFLTTAISNIDNSNMNNSFVLDLKNKITEKNEHARKGRHHDMIFYTMFFQLKSNFQLPIRPTKNMANLHRHQQCSMLQHRIFCSRIWQTTHNETKCYRTHPTRPSSTTTNRCCLLKCHVRGTLRSCNQALTHAYYTKKE